MSLNNQTIIDIANDSNKQFGIGIFLSCLSLTGSVFNAIVIWVLVSNRSLKQSLDRFIINLAFSDLINATTIAIFYIIQTVSASKESYILEFSFSYANILCKVGTFLVSLTTSFSTLILAAISLERFRVIIYPLSIPIRKKWITIIIISIWLLVIIDAVALTMIHGISDTFPYMCFVKTDNYIYITTVSILSTSLTSFFPIMVTLTSYTKIIIHLFKTHPPTDSTSQTLAIAVITRKRNRKIIVLLTITVISMLSSFPYVIAYWYISFRPVFRKGIVAHQFNELADYWRITEVITLAPCTINPVLYNFASSNFKLALRISFNVGRN